MLFRSNREKKNIHVVGLLDTLEYLKKGGRISKTVAFVGGMLSIKPVISIEAGEVAMLGKARGSKQGNNLLVQQIEKAGGIDFSRPLYLGYAGLDDTLLQKYITDSAHLWMIWSLTSPSVVGQVPVQSLRDRYWKPPFA